MAKKNERAIRRKQIRERKAASRAAVFQEGRRRTIVRHGSTKGYDTAMIRDFLDHLLLEVRVQQAENVCTLRHLKSADLSTALSRSAMNNSQAVQEQFQTILKKYETALIGVTAIDAAGATDEEASQFTQAILRRNVERREDQIAHLEALSDLFEEALYCARLPYGFTTEGNPVQLHRVYKVKDGLDQAAAYQAPSYQDLLPLFVGHPLADRAMGRELRSASIIAAEIPGQRRPLVIFGADKVLEAEGRGNASVRVGTFEVSSPQELQFLMAAVREFCGRCDFNGDPWAAFSAA